MCGERGRERERERQRERETEREREREIVYSPLSIFNEPTIRRTACSFRRYDTSVHVYGDLTCLMIVLKAAVLHTKYLYYRIIEVSIFCSLQVAVLLSIRTKSLRVEGGIVHSPLSKFNEPTVSRKGDIGARVATELKFIRNLMTK